MNIPEYIARAVAETTKQRLLRHAVALIGRHSLAVGMRAPLPLLDAWLNGHASMPDRKFLLLVDLLDKIRQPAIEAKTPGDGSKVELR